MICPYCGKLAPWVENKVKYGRNIGTSFMCYYCKPCDAYVGCHMNTRKPLGTMANAHLRRLRMACHEHLDPLWKNKKMFRTTMYKKLSHIFGKEVHIGEADIEMCKKILALTHKQIISTRF